MTPDAGGTNVKGMKFLGANIPADDKDRFDALAKSNDRKTSDEIRRMVREYLERHERRAA